MADLKISQLTGATTPLAGTEVVPLVQSGTTKKVAVSELVKAAGQASSGTGTPAANVVHTFQESASLSTAQRLVNRNNTQAWHVAVDAAAVDDGLYALINPATGQVIYTLAPLGDAAFKLGNLAFGTAAKGVNFTANTPAAGMTSQLLNWYEQGTFTPTIYGGTTAGTTTYVSQVGRYTRVGNVVYYRIYVDWSNQTGTGTLYVGGLPFTSVSLGSTTPGSVYANNLTFTANSSLSCAVVDNTTTLFIVETINNTGAGVVAVDTSASLVLAGMYFTS